MLDREQRHHPAEARVTDQPLAEKELLRDRDHAGAAEQLDPCERRNQWKRLRVRIRIADHTELPIPLELIGRDPDHQHEKPGDYAV